LRTRCNVIWAYINNFQFGIDFPKDIQVHEKVINAADILNGGVYEWEDRSINEGNDC